MTDRELMQQALDALDSDNPDIQLRAATALRARLAQPEPLPEKSKGALSHEENKQHNKKILDKFYEENAHLYKTQPEQKPVAWITTWNEPNDAGVELHWAKQDKGLSSKHTPLFYKSTMNTDSKPVGWLYQTNNTWEQFSFIEPPDDAYDEGSLRPVYTAPPQREWQGLTDEEILEEYRQSYGDDGNLTDIYFAHAIEAKLKEKNHAD